ncbi:hypothetical protein VCHA53O466_140031 [Vibrio chagasii]|nr:hypothetical protein VCHA53O466_140031 [Vibrio chagasii]
MQHSIQQAELNDFIQSVGVPVFGANEFEISSMGDRKLENTVNGDLKGDEKVIKRDDINIANIDMFVFEKDYNIRDNGHEYGINMEHAQEISYGYDDPNNTIPAVEVFKVIVDGQIKLKVHHGHHRVMGARMKAYRDIQKGETKPFRIRYVVISGKTDLELLFSQVDGNSSLALSVLDRAKFYFHAIKLGASASEIAKRAKVSEALVTRYARLFELPEEAKEMIRDGVISANRARDMMDTYQSLEQVLAAMKVEAEEQNSAETGKESASGEQDKPKRKRRSVGIQKPNRKLLSSITDSVSLLSSSLKLSMGLEVAEDEVTNPSDQLEVDGTEMVSLQVPLHIAKQLLESALELDAIKQKNAEHERKVLDKTQEIKDARLAA